MGLLLCVVASRRIGCMWFPSVSRMMKSKSEQQCSASFKEENGNLDLEVMTLDGHIISGLGRGGGLVLTSCLLGSKNTVFQLHC